MPRSTHLLAVAGLALPSAAAAGPNYGEPIMDAYVSIPIGAAKPAVRGGVRLGYRHVPEEANEFGSARLSPSWGTSIGIEGATGQHVRIDFLGHVGASTYEATSRLCTSTTADVGLSYVGGGHPLGLLLGARAGLGWRFAPEVQLGGQVVKFLGASDRPWTDGGLTLGLALGRPIYSAAGGPWVRVPEQPTWVDGRLIRVDNQSLMATWDCPADTPESAKALLRAAAEEWTSVSTFLRTAAELQALGAPRSLIDRCKRAAADEAQHTWRQLHLAAAQGLRHATLGTVPVRPRRWRSRREALADLAVEGWVDGWHGERASARRLAQRRDSARDAFVANHYASMVAEEAEHADLGGAITDWCVREGGDAVRRCLAA